MAPHAAAQAVPRNTEVCPRGAEGEPVREPTDLRSQNKVLKVNFTIRNSTQANGHSLYCYIDDHGNQAPTLRLHPGDTLILTLKNEISLPKSMTGKGSHAGEHLLHSPTRGQADPCSSLMIEGATNLHFHGMAVPPVCHQDETLQTTVPRGGSPFEYRIQIPDNQPPGLYWYHPHVHGFSEDQILGGASGALIVEGIEQAKPDLANLRERVLVIRDQEMPDAPSTQKVDANTPTKDLSINFTPVFYPTYQPALIRMKPSERQLWRVLNASADTYLDLQVLFNGQRQALGLAALDGVPLKYDEPRSEKYLVWQTELLIPPAGRAEFILNGPKEGVKALLVTNAVPRGPVDEYNTHLQLGATSDARRASGQDDNDPYRPLAAIVATSDASEPSSILPAYVSAKETHAPAPLASIRPVRTRKLYFSEKLTNPNDPKSPTIFFITEEGQTPTAFDPNAKAPNITVHQGEVEDWVIENRSQEPHAFHIHQIHFLPIELRGVAYEEPTLRDTINLPAWAGEPLPYPSVRLRMDFRDPAIVGTFPYHCHILQHADAGMMGTVRVEPANE